MSDPGKGIQTWPQKNTLCFTLSAHQGVQKKGTSNTITQGGGNPMLELSIPDKQEAKCFPELHTTED